MFSKPKFTEYVMARLVTLGVFLFILFSVLIVVVMQEREDILLSIVLLGIAFAIFIFSIFRGAKRMQNELEVINRYLKNLDEIEKIDYETRFFTREFEEINENLIRVLKSAKKREDIKQRYNAKLKLKNRQRADMLSAIAHEFRNPIASIMGYSQTLQEDPNIPKVLQEKFLGKVYNNGQKIEDLLSRLILWNKFESGEATLHKSSFSILSLANEVKMVLQEAYKDREVEIIGEDRMMKADRTLIELVLKNLIENALKYSKDIVTVKIEDDRISVIDKGTGISEKDLGKVTKKFYRSGTHNWDNSMGLGLSIVKTILTLHGSRLDIESKLEEGSTFSFGL
ncbi:histidine kinase [Sulfurovum lithotrophicum]|uniref:histidine kinase n=1 Tax=Sulfurovum lithotrophicum TaxID=206403 RepID=A0A7U4M233_9BACT|nr:HAMP domain-containing sensor histidine kinase [Sulfurovum lithotrophicum]AKF25454.1 histidine kinase [Sulfurovum lithotrophicum]